MTPSRSIATLALLPLLYAIGCGGSSSSTATSSATPNSYTAVLKTIAWGSTVSVTYPSACEMTLTTTGQPNYTPNPYYLAPASGSETVVAYTASSKMAMALISYADVASSDKGSTATISICPAKAATTTATGLGAIGYLISGTDMFNPFEADGTTAAVADNASYTFKDANGVTQTAYFLDQCDSHTNGMAWHAHGNPACVTSQVDTATGPSHIIGIALDGFPIYGGRDIDGNVVAPSSLDSCNGITSATPEFPSGAYHYVLPIGVTTKYASINCYSGTVSASTMAQGRKVACNTKTMMAMIKANRKKPDTEARMTMPDGATMPAM